MHNSYDKLKLFSPVTFFILGKRIRELSFKLDNENSFLDTFTKLIISATGLFYPGVKYFNCLVFQQIRLLLTWKKWEIN